MAHAQVNGQRLFSDNTRATSVDAQVNRQRLFSEKIEQYLLTHRFFLVRFWDLLRTRHQESFIRVVNMMSIFGIRVNLWQGLAAVGLQPSSQAVARVTTPP